MSDSPLSRPIQAAKDATDKAQKAIRSRVSILSDGKACPTCGREMDATQAYDATEGAFYDDGYRPAYVCECGYKERREEDRITFDPYE